MLVLCLHGIAPLGIGRTVQSVGDEDGNGMSSHAEAGWESVDGAGAAVGRDGS
jgi:hypothetical protein